MRRAIAATAGTVLGVAALLSYKSSGSVRSVHVAAGGPSSSSSSAPAPTQAPTTTPAPAGPSSSPTTGASAAPTTPPPTAPAAPQTFTGADVSYQYGDLQVRITISGGRITQITTPQDSATDGRSQSINSQAMPILTREALAAQNLNFDVVSGATFTSDAFAQALQSALGKAGR